MSHAYSFISGFYSGQWNVSCLTRVGWGYKDDFPVLCNSWQDWVLLALSNKLESCPPPFASAEKVLAHPRVFRSCLLLMGKLLRIIVFQAGGLKTTAWISLSLHCWSESLTLCLFSLYRSGSISFFLHWEQKTFPAWFCLWFSFCITSASKPII